jgi:hypothetical protein
VTAVHGLRTGSEGHRIRWHGARLSLSGGDTVYVFDCSAASPVTEVVQRVALALELPPLQETSGEEIPG